MGLLKEEFTELKTGWLSPDCKFYPCGYREHSWLAYRINEELYNGELSGDISDELQTRGWLSIHYGRFIYHGYYFGFKFLTPKQIKSLEKIYYDNYDEVSDLARNIETAMLGNAYLVIIKENFPECLPYINFKYES